MEDFLALADLRLIILSRAKKHGLDAAEIEHAWRNAIEFMRIDAPDGVVYKAIGFDAAGRGVEISGELRGDEDLVVFHANRISGRALREFGLDQRR